MANSETVAPPASRVREALMSGEFIFRSLSTGAVLVVMSLLLAGDTHFSTSRDVSPGIYVFALIFRVIGALLILAALTGIVRQFVRLAGKIRTRRRSP